MNKIYKYSYFISGNSNTVFRFSVKPPGIQENRIKINILVNFQIKLIKSSTRENLSAETL